MLIFSRSYYRSKLSFDSMNTAISLLSGAEFEIILTGHHIIKYHHEDFIRINTLHVYITREMMVEVIDVVREFSRTSKVKILVDPTNTKGMSRDARKYLVGSIAFNTSKLAILTSNFLAYTIASFIMKLDKPEFEMRSFNDILEAKRWLTEA